ncbi:porin [Acidisoma cladoniae]|uniref:porin n=1 Tax=Acidisoma cladoniae TaxID=3040935 RepID=UPI00254EAABF|nr:porin [Acidisoma sp. PAMC 29798]
MRKLLLATVATMGASMGLMAVAQAQTAAPGSVTVRLNGRVAWYAGVEASSLDSIAGTKTSTAQMFGYMRLYPGFDGVAANGLHYGAASEIRINGGSKGAGGETLFVHQAYGYLGLPKLGQVSFGQENGPVVIFETGTFEGFNDGGWWGDLPAIVPNNAEVVYPFVDNGGLSQETDKIVYLSPTLAGFQFGAAFEPNHTAENVTDPITSAPTLAPAGGTPRNLIDVGGQFTQTFGPVGIQVGADYMHAGQVNYTGAPEAGAVNSYHDLSMVSGGATATIAGFTFGGNAVYGDFNQVSGYTFQLEPQGGINAVAFLVGAQYTMGPLVVGGSVFRFNTTGDIPGGSDADGVITAAGLTTGQQVNNGLALGGTYTLVPGVNLFVDYDYGWRKQGGFDFATNDAGSAHNYVQSQLFGVGTNINW